MLQALLSTHEGVIETLQIKVIPPSIEKEPTQKQTKNIPSTENIDFILDQAEHQSNEKLKNALLKLGKTFQKKSKERSQNKLSS
jgi:hypothetical protein